MHPFQWSVFLLATIAICSPAAFTADQVWVDDLHAPMFTTVDIPVYLENTETSVQAFSLRLTTDTAVLDYTGYSRGTLTEDFQALGVGEVLQGVMIVQGFDDTTGIPSGSNGSLAILHFDVLTGACDLLLSDFSDDIAAFEAVNGSFLACQPEWLWLVRSLPDTCCPGQPFEATYSYQGGSAAIIQTAETLPADWTVISPPWDDLVGNTYIWNGPIFSCTILPPANAAGGTYTITGTTISNHWCNGNVTHDITGDQTIVMDISTPTPTPPCIHDGDVNADGELTAADAQHAFLIALGSITPTWDEACAADCNGDGEITAGDAQLIFLAVLGAGNCVDPL